MRPIRGQILLLEGPPNFMRRTLNVGRRYVVPRKDGHLLVGSTQEDVGFDKEITSDARAQLQEFAIAMCPGVASLPVKLQWSGLRPHTRDELPIIGPAPNLKNVWLATGHFRAGLQLSTGTAVVASSLIRGETPTVDCRGFGINR